MSAVVVALRGTIVYPGMLRVLVVGRATSVAAVEAHVEGDETLVLAVQRDADLEDPVKAELARVGVLADILRVTAMPDGSYRVLAEGKARAHISPLRVEDGVTRCDATPITSTVDEPIAVDAQARQLATLYGEYLTTSGVPEADQSLVTVGPENPERLADQIAGVMALTMDEHIAHLEEVDLSRRLDKLLHYLAVVIAQQRIASDISARVQTQMDKSQREYHLKEQLAAIRAELGDKAGVDAEKFTERIEQSGMPDEVRTEALREVERLRHMHTDAAEYTIIRTWLETLCDLPWNQTTSDQTTLSKAQRVLDRDHYGLVKVKERILEYLAVRQLQPDSKGPILCFVGPPGVGKTSLGRSIARALGRNFGRIALGGIKDETEIRGHRRTYVGALPGRIIRSLIRAGSRNPVLVLDEIDKLGNDFRGDPASALLEVLDPEQNNTFVDHYLDVHVDLSQILFIATANLMDPIPPALFDRLEIIELPGYIEEEKIHIARKFLLPKLAASHGLSKRIRINKSGLSTVIRDYTREAGLRELERQLAAVHRKVARQVVEGVADNVRLSHKTIKKYLGPPRYFQELAERVDQPGVVIGLAWTAAGGDILFVEAAKMPGSNGLKLTGSLGDVMKESVEAAMSWLRSNALSLKVPQSAFDAEFHLHVPAGAIPKDGPSAGVTMVTALASIVTGKYVDASIAMTGEITLRGKVLPVGGVKEKVLAARRAGVQRVVLPARNQTDLEDIPPEIRQDLTFHFVDSVDQVLALALEEP